MGKRIIQRRRGRGTPAYRVRKKAFSIKVKYPSVEGKGKIIDIIHNVAHHAPLAKIKVDGEVFYNVAPLNSYVGQEIIRKTLSTHKCSKNECCKPSFWKW